MTHKPVLTLLVALFAMAGAAGAAEKYPSKPIRMLVPFSAGSQTDILARWIGEKVYEGWGQRVVVDNRPARAAPSQRSTCSPPTPTGTR